MRSFLQFAWRHNGAIALVAFAIVGLAVFDDYGVGVDEGIQRGIGENALDYALGALGLSDKTELIDYHTRFYGVAFEIPLVIVERALGLEHSREIILMRHLLAHLFFLAGGFFAWLLARRMFGSPALALCAMLLFLLQPRIYAQSFFNTKDPIFLSGFMVALYLIHRAFERKTVWAFICAGAAVGLIANVRILGIGLYAAALGLFALDFCLRVLRADDDSSGGVGRILANAAAFATAAPLTLYLTWPLLWANPLAEFARGLDILTTHPIPVIQVFMGETVHNTGLPPHFQMVWIALTAPPMTLALALVGALATLWNGAARPPEALRNTETRFRLLLVACLALTLATLAAFTPDGSDGWRQVYFLHAPICLLAACGLGWLARAASAPARRLAGVLRAHVHASPAVLARASVYALAALGFAFTALEMASVHPFQHAYFNAFSERSAPGYLRTRYDIELTAAANTEGIRYLAAAHPDPNLTVAGTPWSWGLLSEERKASAPRHVSGFADFYLTSHRESAWSGNIETDLFAPAIYSRSVYGNPVTSVLAVNLDLVDAETAAPYRALLAAAKTGALGQPIAREGYDVYLHGNALILVNEDCDAPQDADGGFRISAAPKDAADLPRMYRDLGSHPMKFGFGMYGVALDGACLIRRPLPDYPLRAIVAVRSSADRELWRAHVMLPPDADELATLRAEYARASAGEPLIRAEFDVYADGDSLVYIKETCAQDDARGRFLLSLFPANPADLPDEFAELGHESRNFTFALIGAAFDGKCMAAVALPDYPVRVIKTGQWVPNREGVWNAVAQMPPDADALAWYRAEYARISSGEPLIRAEFDVYADGGDLVYIKDSCAEDDSRGRFLLSLFPVNPADLPAEFAELGHESRNFAFAPLGVRFDGNCMAWARMPDYPVREIETGRWIPGEPGVWTATAQMPPDAAALLAWNRAEYARISSGEPLIRAEFDVYADGGYLVYIKESCAEDDTRGRFLLSVFPENPNDLPDEFAELGHESRNFEFDKLGIRFDGNCMARVALPNYPIRAVETGRWIPGGATAWREVAELRSR